MNREAAALGVPVYTTYGGRLGGVDEALIRDGRLVPLSDPRALRLEKREAGASDARPPRAQPDARATPRPPAKAPDARRSIQSEKSGSTSTVRPSIDLDLALALETLQRTADRCLVGVEAREHVRPQPRAAALHNRAQALVLDRREALPARLELRSRARRSVVVQRMPPSPRSVAGAAGGQSSSQRRYARSIARCGWPAAVCDERRSTHSPAERSVCLKRSTMYAGDVRDGQAAEAHRAPPARRAVVPSRSNSSFIRPCSEPAKTYDATSPWCWMWLRRIASSRGNLAEVLELVEHDRARGSRRSFSSRSGRSSSACSAGSGSVARLELQLARRSRARSATARGPCAAGTPRSGRGRRL